MAYYTIVDYRYTLAIQIYPTPPFSTLVDIVIYRDQELYIKLRLSAGNEGYISQRYALFFAQVEVEDTLKGEFGLDLDN